MTVTTDNLRARRRSTSTGTFDFAGTTYYIGINLARRELWITVEGDEIIASTLKGRELCRLPVKHNRLLEGAAFLRAHRRR